MTRTTSSPLPGTDRVDPAAAAAAGAEQVAALFRRYATQVYGYVRLRTTPELPDIADDVVADTFITAWRLRDRIPADPLPWLLVIARNALANRQRSAKRSARLTVAMVSVRHLARHEPAAEDVVIARDDVMAALSSLPDEQREALFLTAWDGLAQGEAADLAGCSERTFARRLRRAREHLDRELGAPTARDVAPAPAQSSIPVPAEAIETTGPDRGSTKEKP